jgi:hypothetical protein
VTPRVSYRWTPTCPHARHPLNIIYISIVSFSLLTVSFMSKVASQPDGTFDVDSLRLPSYVAAPVSPSKPVRFRRGQRFLRGPIPWDWLSVAAGLPGKALQVGLAVWHLAGLKNAMTAELSRVPLENLGVTRQAGYRGLKALENAGLIKAERRRGCKTRVTILVST